MGRKSEPFTLRLSASTDALITEEARRTRCSKGAIVESLAEEALRTRLFPGIAFYERFPDEIDAAIAESRRSLDALHGEFPTIDMISVSS